MANFTQVVRVKTNRKGYVEGESILPEDVEMKDLQGIKKMIDDAFDRIYPKFVPEIIHTFEKDYFLPALKVLVKGDTGIYSPQYSGKWENMELRAECLAQDFLPPQLAHRMLPNGTVEVYSLDDYKPTKHNPPHEGCDCGIYGSVHLEEINGYINLDASSIMSYHPYIPNKKILCIIEPSPGAEVVVCRKGWKASRAFLSEIVGETIPVDDASRLLSIAWKRDIDVREVARKI